MASGRLNVQDLISEHIPQHDASSAYRILTESPNKLGIILTYPTETHNLSRTITLSPSASTGVNSVGVGLIGVGNFGSRILLPALAKSRARLVTVASASGTSAALAAQRHKFQQATSDYKTILSDPAINTVVIATRHNTHARIAVEALRAGKHVFVEKPLALNREELNQIEEALRQAPGLQLMVGFNRRFSPLSIRLRKLLDGRAEPCNLIYTVNAGAIPANHWTQDPSIGGGRIIGEACHFIDLLRFLVGKPIVGVEARMIGRASGVEIREDKMSILLDFEDGSTGTVHYLANGSKSFPKERVEVFSEERIAVLQNFKTLQTYGWKDFKGMRLSTQDKGHNAEIAAFIDRVTNGGDLLIPWQELEEVTLATFIAMERAQEPARSLTETPLTIPEA
jgi:predicted dehydrogenase